MASKVRRSAITHVPRKAWVGARVRPGLWARFRDACGEAGVTQSAQVEQLVQGWCEQFEAAPVRDYIDLSPDAGERGGSA